MAGSDIITKIDIPTKDLHMEVIQEVLHMARRSRIRLKEHLGLNEILHLLWDHLETGLRKFDDQLLCSVCFYTVLEFSQKKEYYLGKVLELVSDELALKEKLKLNHNPKLFNDTKTCQVVALMYGLVQSKCIFQICPEEIPVMVDLFHLSLELLIVMAYEYSRYTFIVFKILSSYKTFCGTELEKVLFDTDKNFFSKLLTLVNQNWENPITGVRDLNKLIFQMLLSICNKNCFEYMLSRLEKGFYWNKAKYLMVAEIIEQQCYFGALDHWIKIENHWIDGLLRSLYKPGLVSAGADMYYAILKKLSSNEEWCDLFLNRVVNVLQGSSAKAIENFSNYWCLTTFKKFPDLSKILIDKLDTHEQSELKLYSSLCILKQANKLGLVTKQWNTMYFGFAEHKVLDGIEHPNAQIRMLAFEVIAVTVGKSMPTSVEYKLILDFLNNNVNSDSTVLRISMLGNIKCFLANLCASFMDRKKHNQDCESYDLRKFFQNLQEFIIQSLNLNGNYQRKVATLKLCYILLSSLNEVPKKRQKQTAVSGTAVIKFLKENDSFILCHGNFLEKLFDLLKDPSDDIRDSIVQLLLDHYSKEITAPLINNLIEDAKKCMTSKFFYQISCGQSMFRLISSLLLKENYKGTTFESIDDVFNFGYGVLKSECALKGDIVKSIEDGKQLHAYISILQEVLKVSKQFSREIKGLGEGIPRLLHILEMVSNQFAWEEEPAVSSDFSKMSDMVQSIIATSGYNPLDEKDFAKISGLQQIVLNCLWLNVKASCDFAACLVTSFTAEADAAACDKCLDVITTVLETSRHKGAIEAAGAALGRAITHLTSLPEASSLSRLPRALLSRLLRALAASGAASVTRRGAGRAIMLHRLVASDAARGKPLFHYFMETLLQTCNSDEDIPQALDDGQKDVPKAVYIHFLTRVVTDSGLASDMMHYSADLAEIAFGNLTSPNWQIRNAALQLYGALVPKLIGQKKASGSDDEAAGTVAVDEFRTHSPRLWHHIITCLQNLDDSNTLESHSNVLPILNVLANLAKRYHFQSEVFPTSQVLLEKLEELLGSPIFTIRRLTAKCIFNIYGHSILNNTANKFVKFQRENFLHGYLLLIQHYYKHANNKKEIELHALKELAKFIQRKNHSYVNRIEFEYFEYDLYGVQKILAEVKCNKYLPGAHHWANNRLEKYIRYHSEWDEIPAICKIFLEENDYEKYCEFILAKMESASSIPQGILTDIGDILLKFRSKFQSCVVWKMLYHMSLQVEFSNIDMSIFDYLQTDVPYKIRFVVPFLASVASKIPSDYLIRLSDIITSLCDPDKSDVDMRYIAALANNEIAKVFPKMPDSVKISAIKCAILLLQDEDEDVRKVNIIFYANIKQERVLLQPFVCLTKILEKQFLKSCLDDPQIGIQVICKDLLETLVSYGKTDDIDEYNPFSNDSKNIYFESEHVKQLIQNVKD